MKSGTGDDPFAETDDTADESTTENDHSTPRLETESDLEDTVAGSEASSGQTIPYKFRRSSVKEDRKQRPIFLRPHIEERESAFLRTLEDELGEDVYKTDALEAALVVAMDNPDLVVDELREWGYDWD
ncbi:hypothetical protein ACFQJ5_17700 [Halomicroarcula sp. GCM10025324]|uniref:hypothetical protein n=1 Tax=Haloarcula TaxID=2237 RepID=UPI0023E868FC|nr:hypothetical protein [Halomicroarcula sp. ZS-22-S1]